MIEKPSGTVTFLFTDIEGSTKLAHDYPDIHQSILEQHHSILRNAIESNGGFVFEIIGDAFCSAFGNAGDALYSAIKIQSELAEEFSGEIKIRVRIGIHTGITEWNGDSYMGYITLARSQRIMSAGYGGQVLLSKDSYDNIKADDLSKFSFRDLGERRLKDMIVPIRLYQLTADNLQQEFPPLKTLDARPNNLPVQLTTFIGREKEIAEVKKLMSDSRLLTFTGPGGTGKTRLSMQVAVDVIDEFDHGVWLTELASLKDPDFIMQAIARSIGISEQANQNTETAVFNFLVDKKLLIILDNCEHLIEACAELSERMLNKFPDLKIIATSREALRCSGETIYKVQALSIPDPEKNISLVSLSQYESVRLFIERALSVKPDFRINNYNAPAVSQICYRLDGIPLAIELAAARINVLTPENICDKLNNRFNLLTKGSRTALPRQQTLKALIDWSYDMLNEKEKLFLQRLSVFSGGWTLESAEEICSDEIIDSMEIMDLHTNLLDKSLINSIEKSGVIKFFLLETIRHYAKEKLIDDTGIKRKHYEYYSKIADYDFAMKTIMKQEEWINNVDNDISNIRKALTNIIEDNHAEAIEFLTAMTNYWKMKGYYFEGYQTCNNLLMKNTEVSPDLKASLMYNTGLHAYGLGNITESKRLGAESLELFRKCSNKNGIAQALNLVAVNLSMFSSDDNEILKLYNEAYSLYCELNNKKETGTVLYNMSFPLQRMGRMEEALNHKLESLKIFKEFNDAYQILVLLANLGSFEISRGNYKQAKIYTEESLAGSKKLDDKYLISANLINSGNVYFGMNEFEKSEQLYEEALLIMQEQGYKSHLLAGLVYLGDVNLKLNKADKAKYYYSESLKLGRDTGNDFFLSKNLLGMGICFFNEQKYEYSLKCFLVLQSLLDKNGIINGRIKEDGDLYREKLKNILSEECFQNSEKDTFKVNKEEIVNYVLELNQLNST